MSKLRMLFVLITALALIAQSGGLRAARISFEDWESRGIKYRDILLEGVIEKGDLEKIKALVDGSRIVELIQIVSPGGDVAEALQIASFVNDRLIAARAPLKADSLWLNGGSEECVAQGEIALANCVCNSACAIIWLTAPMRQSGGSIGVHRPYFDQVYFAGLSVEDAKEKYAGLMRVVTRFMEENDVPDQIVEVMNRVTSSDIHLLTDEEMTLVPMQRPFLVELVDARCSAFLAYRDREKELIARDDRLNRDLDAAMAKDKLDVAHKLLAERKKVVGQLGRLIPSPYNNCVKAETLKLRAEAQGVQLTFDQ